MKRIAFAVLLFLASATPSFAQFGFPGGDTAPKATIEGSLQQRSGDEVQGTIVATIAEGWHVNSNKPLEEFAIPTVLELDPATAELIGEPAYPPHQMKAFAFTGGKPLAVYDGKFNIGFRAKLKPGATKIGAILKFQACSDTVCLPPNTAAVDIDVSKISAAPAPTGAGHQASGTPRPGDNCPEA